MSERRYVALCGNCGDERKLSRGVVLTGKIPVCQSCEHYMDVHSLDPRPPAPPRPCEVE